MNTPKKTPAAAKFILEEFKNIYEKKNAKKIYRDNSIPVFKYKNDIVDYLFENTNIKRSDDFDPNDPEHNNSVYISSKTVINAINLLLRENLIHKVNGEYCYNPPLTTNRHNHPILSIAAKIDVKINSPEYMLILTVPHGLADVISEYLTAVFYKGDIIFLPNGNYIVCIGVIPQSDSSENSDNESKNPKYTYDFFKHRIEVVMREFNCSYPKFKYGAPYEYPYVSQYDPETRQTLHQITHAAFNTNSSMNDLYESENELFDRVMSGIAITPNLENQLMDSSNSDNGEESDFDYFCDDSLDEDIFQPDNSNTDQ